MPAQQSEESGENKVSEDEDLVRITSGGYKLDAGISDLKRPAVPDFGYPSYMYLLLY